MPSARCHLHVLLTKEIWFDFCLVYSPITANFFLVVIIVLLLLITMPYTGKIKEVKIGTMKTLSSEDCCSLLNEFMPPHVRRRKISQKLYIRLKIDDYSMMMHMCMFTYRYMHRRCHFLEECPYLKYNQGFAPGVPVKDETTGKMVQKKEDYKDTSKLRSVLFNTMRREVTYFSEHCVGDTHERGRQYHQVFIIMYIDTSC